MSLLFTFVVGAIVILFMAFKVFRLWFSSQDTVAIDCEMVACVPNEEWIKNARKPNKDEVKVAVHCAIVESAIDNRPPSNIGRACVTTKEAKRKIITAPER